MSKPCKFDVEVRGQRLFGIMNVCETLSHGDAPMYQSMVSQNKKSYGQDTNLHRQTDRQTDGQIDRRRTERWTEWFLYNPLNFVHGGIINEISISFLNTFQTYTYVQANLWLHWTYFIILQIQVVFQLEMDVFSQNHFVKGMKFEISRIILYILE